MSQMHRRCSKCGATQASNPELRMHRFPALSENNENFYQVLAWATFCFPEKDWFDIEALRRLQKSSKVICSRHFDDSAYTSIHKMRLSKFAMPVIGDETKENIHIPTAGPSHRVNPNILVENKQIVQPDTPQLMSETNSNVPSDSMGNKQIVQPETPQLMSEDNSNVPSVAMEQKQIVQAETPQLVPEKNSNTPLMDTMKSTSKYNKCRRWLKKVVQMKTKLKQRKSIDILQMLHGNENIKKLLKLKISPSMALLLQGELQNGQIKHRGRRWTENQKFLALELYKKSPRVYKLLNRLFCLPSPSTLKRLLGHFVLKPGINEIIFQNLKKTAKKNTEQDNVCFLTFDEMSIMKNITYNKKTDEIEGYQDHGLQGKSKVFVSYALVFMLVWIRQMRKQPVSFYLSGDYVTADRLTVLIKEVLHECLKTGMKVCATVCDMDGVNVKALENLGSSVEHPYFDFEGNEIITLPDPPHLLKCLRNLFMKYDVKLPIPVQSTTGIGVASWKHIEQFFELDNSNPHFVFAPKLSKRHIQPNGKEKMRVKLATQIFSHSVAMGIYSKASTNELPPDAIATATLLEKFNNLFDLLNANAPDRQDGKPYKTNWTTSSPHKAYITEAKTILSKMEFIGCKRTPPSQTGWLKLLNGYERLWHNLNKYYNIKTITTRRINQDPLENLFGCIRANCGSNDNPTVSQFVAGLKTSMITNLRNSVDTNRNCEEDSGELLENFRFLFKQKLNSKVEIAISADPLDDSGHELNVSEEDVESSAEAQACAYVCGFIFKKYAKNCDKCKRAMLAEHSSDVHLFTQYKEYVEGKQSLQYANHRFIACVEKSAEVVTNYLKENPHSENLKKNCITLIKEKIDFNFLKECPEHFTENVNMIEQSACIILINRFCILQNRRFATEYSQKRLAKKMKILNNS